MKRLLIVLITFILSFVALHLLTPIIAYLFHSFVISSELVIIDILIYAIVALCVFLRFRNAMKIKYFLIAVGISTSFTTYRYFVGYKFYRRFDDKLICITHNKIDLCTWYGKKIIGQNENSILKNIFLKAVQNNTYETEYIRLSAMEKYSEELDSEFGHPTSENYFVFICAVFNNKGEEINRYKLLTQYFGGSEKPETSKKHMPVITKWIQDNIGEIKDDSELFLYDEENTESYYIDFFVVIESSILFGSDQTNLEYEDESKLHKEEITNEAQDVEEQEEDPKATVPTVEPEHITDQVYQPEYVERDEWVPCYNCNGSGDCQACNGMGYDLYGQTMNNSGIIQQCVVCGGGKRCAVCYGQRGKYERRMIKVR